MKYEKPYTFSAENGANNDAKQDLQEVLEHWKQQGLEPYIHQQAIWFMYMGCLWQDEGDRITLHTDSKPTARKSSSIVQEMKLSNKVTHLKKSCSNVKKVQKNRLNPACRTTCPNTSAMPSAERNRQTI